MKSLKSSTLFFVFTGLVFQSGCAHLHPVDGAVAKSEIPEGFQVRIGGAEVAEGEKVTVLQPVCTRKARVRGGTINECKDVKAGEATVLKILDHDSAIVQPDGDFKMDRTMKVEKIKK